MWGGCRALPFHLLTDSLLRRRLGGGAGTPGRGEHESFANERKALLREFGLKKLVSGTEKQVRVRLGDGCHHVMDGDRLPVEGAMLVRIRRNLNGVNRAGLFGDDDPKIAAVLSVGQGEERLLRARVKIRNDNCGG